ncbi:MAG TPA: M23 family metallopeptidase [Dehalococcoidia bacterium]|nr:M23 family metallopeptidase [Dehalococcoidia bacterium]
MRQNPRRLSSQRPWYASNEARLGAVIVALILLAGGAALMRTNEPIPGAGVVLVPSVPPIDGLATAATSNGSASPSASGAATETPTPSATPQPLLIDLRPPTVGQGETMLVWVHAPGAFNVALDFRGEIYNLVPEGEVFWGVVGAPLDAALGADELTVTATSSSGDLIETQNAPFEVIHVERPVDYITLTDEVASVLTPEAAEQERQLRERIFTEFDRGRRWSTYFRFPTEGPMSSEFGQGRSYNGGPVGGFHTGTDIAAPEGTPILAAGPARVDWVGEMPVRGISVVLDHGAGVKTGYHHLSAAFVAVDEIVEAGQLIGEVGSTGLSTGPHLHWELTVWGVNVSPVSWTLKDFTP